jgi:hypothetical protein
MWKDILKAPPFDAVRYEKEVSPRKQTLTRFFADALDEPIREGINKIRFRKPAGKSRKYRGYTAELSPETFRLYEDYIKGLLVNEEFFPNHRNNDLKDRVKRRLRQEYNMQDVGLSFYYPEKGLFSIGFTLTDEGNAGNMEKVAGAVTTSSPAHSHLFKPTYGERRKRKKKKEE